MRDRENRIKTVRFALLVFKISQRACCLLYRHAVIHIGTGQNVKESMCMWGMMIGGWGSALIGALLGRRIRNAMKIPSVKRRWYSEALRPQVSQAARNVSVPTQRRAIQSSLPCSPWRPGCLIPSDGPGKSAESLSVRVWLQPASPNQVKVSGTESGGFKWIIRACDYGSFSPADASG